MDNINAKKFRTRQEFKIKTNPKDKDYYVIGLDAGYSGMKVFYENGYFCFPSFVRQMTSDTIEMSEEDDILYEDVETGERYMVGRTAQKMVNSLSTNDTDGELFSRKRYNNEKFKILLNTAIGLAIENKKDNKEIFIQTGLPSSYLEADTKHLVKALAKPVKFRIKKGSGKWSGVIEIGIDPKNIDVKAQPCGSMYSVLITSDGNFIPHTNKILNSNTLVMDIGFRTYNYYGVKTREIVCKDSIDNIGMRMVMQEVSRMIRDEYDEDIRIQALQNVLDKGYFTCVDDDKLEQTDHSVKEILKKANEIVFARAMKQAKAATNSFRDYEYIIITGGTGEAWYEDIKDYLSKMKFHILPGNVNDPIPFIYSNVRGYYLFRYITDKIGKKDNQS